MSDTWRVIATIAGNARRELVARGVPTLFVVVFIAFLLFFWNGVERHSVAENYVRFLTTIDNAMNVASCLAFILSANLYESETSRRMLVGIMVHPVEPWMHLLGRLTGMVIWYVGFAVLTFLCGFITCYECARQYLDQDVFGVVFQNIVLGVTWITIGTTLGALTTQWRAVAIAAIALMLSRAVNNVSSRDPWFVPYLHEVCHFLALVGPDPSKPRPSLTTFDAFRAMDNLFYAATFFIGGAAVLERRDVPTRGG